MGQTASRRAPQTSTLAPTQSPTGHPPQTLSSPTLTTTPCGHRTLVLPSQSSTRPVTLSLTSLRQARRSPTPSLPPLPRTLLPPLSLFSSRSLSSPLSSSSSHC